MKDYEATVRDGIVTIPQVQEIKRVFPTTPTDNFISMYGIDRTKPVMWNTQVNFGGRYTFTFQVKVVIDYQNNKILRTVTQPKFSLEEATRIYNESPDNIAAEFSKGSPFQFGIQEWNKIVAAGGDFSVIGIHLNTNAPLPRFDEYVNAGRLGMSIVVW